MAITAQGSMAKSGIQPREIEAGVIAVTSVYSCTATLSSGDIIEMIKLPDGAKIVDMILNTYGDLAGSPGKLNVGTADDHDKYIASASANAAAPVHINVIAASTGVGQLEDISDDATTRYTMIRIKASDTGAGSSTAATVLTLTALYYMDA